MKFFDFLLGRQSPTASEVAKGRLKVVLVQDRVKLTPDTLTKIKEELIAVLSKYVEIDEKAMEINLTQHHRADKLIADIPIRRQGLEMDDELGERHSLRPAPVALSTGNAAATQHAERALHRGKNNNKGSRRRR